MNYVIYLKQYQSLEKKNLVQPELTSDMGKDSDQNSEPTSGYNDPELFKREIALG